jgi:hypothetical protein
VDWRNRQEQQHRQYVPYRQQDGCRNLRLQLHSSEQCREIINHALVRRGNVQNHIVERFQRPDFGHLNVQVTYEDPGTLTKPVVRNAVWDLATEDDVLEFVCENNKEGVAAQNDARGVR